MKQPTYVIEELTKDNLSGDANRSHFRFKEDFEVHLSIRSLLSDYQGSGYDRGHLVPAGDLRCSREGMRDSFLLSNICPQRPEFNRGYWSKLEKHVRELIKVNDKVTVVTGPLFLPQFREDGKKYVLYEVIGANDVAVPTHLFKVIIYDGVYEGYVIPNKKIEPNTPLVIFKEEIEKIEKISGIIFSLE